MPCSYRFNRRGSCWLALPSEPVAHGLAHHKFQVPALQPWQFFSEHRYALPVTARHARDIGAPEESMRPIGIEDAMQPIVYIAERIRRVGIAWSAGRLYRDVRTLRQRAQRIKVDERRGALR